MNDKKDFSILIVDDEPNIVLLYKQILQSQYIVHTATTANEALEILEKEAISLVISDRKMPGIDGLKMVQEIRNRDNNKNIFIVISTGVELEENDIEAFMGLGVSSFLLKPISVSELLNCVKDIFELYQQRNK